MIVTDCEAVPPALVAVQVSVVPVVSVVMLVVPQPEVLEMVDSLSTTLQLTLTLLVYQPFVPSVPVTVGVITGGVVSETRATLTVFEFCGCHEFGFVPTAGLLVKF